MPAAVETHPPKVLLRMEEAAEMLSLSRASIYNLIERGDLPRVKFGRSARIPEASVRELISRKLQSCDE